MALNKTGCAAYSLLLFVLLSLLPQSSAMGQTEPQSPADLIRFLTYQSGRPRGLRGIVFSCGSSIAQYREDHPVAEALVKMGGSAIPDLQAALDSIESSGGKSEFAFNSGWLLDAYARIKGPAAFPHLRSMFSNPQLTLFRSALEHSMALSLGITSYVSDSGELAEMASCSGMLGPKNLLDQLILAWERNDRHWVEASLGPRAKNALGSMLKNTTWPDLRAKLWRGKSGDVAVGYAFMTQGWWLGPDDTTEIRLERLPANPEIETAFKSKAGSDCGEYRIKFLLTKEYYFKYLVDNPDLEGLLHAIATCAAMPEGASQEGNSAVR